MKHPSIIVFLTSIALLFSFTINAQDEKPRKTPEWISGKGYWVVESKKSTPKDCFVYFYNNDHVLVYKEEIRNQKLNLNRKKTLLRFKAALEDAIIGYEKGTWAHHNQLLTMHLRD